jgi:hypothetical protein
MRPSDHAHDARPDAPAADAASSSTPLAPSPDREHRATTHPADESASPVSEPPRKQHGDALLDGSGSRQGTAPDPALDAAPRD